MAIIWYQKASNQGFLESQVNLMSMYREGLGIPKENKEQFEWFFNSAKKNNIMSQYKLAEFYYLGDKIERDYLKAYAWAGVVAARGFKPAEEIRDKIEGKFTSEQLIEARLLAKNFWNLHVKE